jgi:hypothetical protein
MFSLVKLFGSNCRTKILEKFFIEHATGNGKTGFFIRELCRDLNEQINSVRRELINLETIGLLKSREQDKKKFYILDKNCVIFQELLDIFMKTYDPIGPIEDFFKGKKSVGLITVSGRIRDLLSEPSNQIVDIFIIGDVDRIEFNNFLERVFFGRKIKYAIMSEADFIDRLEFNDKLVLSILGQKNTLFLKDKLGIEEIV